MTSVTVALTNPVINDLSIRLNIGGSEVIAIRLLSLVFLSYHSKSATSKRTVDLKLKCIRERENRI